jgi:choline dehydrogenase-like flavoprotein
MRPLGQQWFEDTVSALAYSLAGPHHASPGLEAPYNDLTQFVLAQHARMPDYLRTPMLVAALGFDMFGCLKHGTRFHRQAPAQREQQVRQWRQANLGLQRDLIRYFESLATLALYSRNQMDADEASPGRFVTEAQATAGAAADLRSNVIRNPAAELRVEIAVIGSGPGGALTACLLAESGAEVLLLEEGPFLPLESCEPFTREEMLQKYRNGGQTVALGKSKIAYVEARCVGGGSEINSGLYHRTPADVLERWRKDFQVEALTEQEMEPHFAACERELSVSPLPGLAPAASLKLHEGALKLGWKSLEVPRWFRYDTSPGGAPKGQRQSMTKTYLPRFLGAGGRLLPDTRVLRLHQNGAKWSITASHASSGPIRVQAEQVFLCAGAVHSPAVLRRSGISRNIGNSLQLHPSIKIVATFNEAVNAHDMGVPVHQVKEFSPRLSFGCSISSPAYISLGLIDHPATASATGKIWRNTAIYYTMITSEGRGSVRPLPGFRDPLVRYSLTRNDRRNLADGLHKLSQSLLASGATALYPGFTRAPVLHCDGCLGKLPEELPEGLANLMTIHLFSSCPMGEERNQCATDSFGRLHGFSNLFVNDASLLCTAPGVNPQGSIMALARRNTLHYLAGRPRSV